MTGVTADEAVNSNRSCLKPRPCNHGRGERHGLIVRNDESKYQQRSTVTVFHCKYDVVVMQGYLGEFDETGWIHFETANPLSWAVDFD